MNLPPDEPTRPKARPGNGLVPAASFPQLARPQESSASDAHPIPEPDEPANPFALPFTLPPDFKWVWGWSIFVLLLSFAPFILGYYVTVEDGRFMGLLWNATDANVYLSKMEAGRRGEWLFHLTFTSEDHPGILIYTHYYLLGKLAGLLSLPNVFVFHLARLAMGGLSLWASWRFLGRYFEEHASRRTAFLLVCFGAGLGWLVVPLGLTLSTDLWVAESLTFFSILAQPHYPLAAALLMFALMWVQDAFEANEQGASRKAWTAYVKAAVIGLLLSTVHPFLVITLGCVAGLFLLRQIAQNFVGMAAKTSPFMAKLRWRDWAGLVLIGLLSLPMPIYVFIATNSHPVYAGWAGQNQTLSPLPFYYMLGYGFLFGLALVGGWWAERHSPLPTRRRWQLLTTWAITVAILLYLPVSFQRRFVEGLHLPIVLLATAGFFYLTRNWRPKKQARRAYQFVILTSISTLLVLGIFVANIFGRTEPNSVHPLYLYGEEVTALNWLRANTALTDTVIASPLLGNYIPAYAGNRTYYGHELETIRRDEKAEQLKRFFQFKMSRDEMTSFIRQNNLRYVFFGPEEARLFAQGREDNSEEEPPLPFVDLQELGWQRVFSTAKVQIYRLLT